MTELSGPVKAPASNGAAKQAVVFLHGYGSNGDDLIGLAPFFAQALPDAAFYSPNAPEPWEGGGFGGRQWFTLVGYDPELLRGTPAAAADMDRAFFDGATRSAVVLNQYLDKILQDLKLPASKLAVIGFSQGTMMALHTVPRRATPIGGVVGFSGALVGAERLPNEVKSRPPFLLIHGDADPVVPVQALSNVEKALKSAQIPYESHIMRGLEHGIDQPGAMLAAKFLQAKLG